MSNTISNTDDMIDSRDIVERFEELEAEREALAGESNDEDRKEWDEENGEELKTLRNLIEQIDGYAGDNASDGVGLIRDSYFNAAMDELLEDIGDIPKDLPSYLTITVDYKALQMDYTSCEFDGVTYWFR